MKGIPRKIECRRSPVLKARASHPKRRQRNSVTISLHKNSPTLIGAVDLKAGLMVPTGCGFAEITVKIWMGGVGDDNMKPLLVE